MNDNLKKIVFNPVRYYGRLLKDGKEKIDLTLGEGHFDSPFSAKIKAYEAMLNNHTRYGKVEGENNLKELLVEKYYPMYNYSKEIVITNGSTNAFFSTFLALFNKGDEVIIVAPYYPFYLQVIDLLGLIPIIINTTKETDYKITVELLEQHVTYRTKGIVINEPCNPTGVIYSKDEKYALLEYFDFKNLYVIVDELYRHFTDESFISFSKMLTDYKNLTEQFVFINGLSKSHLMTGYRIGYAVSSENNIKNIINVSFMNISCVSTIMQEAAIGALGEEDFSNFVKKYYLQNTEMIRESLNQLKINYVPHYAGYYIFIDVSSFKMTDIEFCEYFIENYNVALVPGFLFGDNYHNFVRISCCKDVKVLIKFINILTDFVEKVK